MISEKWFLISSMAHFPKQLVTMILTLLLHKDIPIKHASHKINAESWYHQGFHHIKWLFPSIGLSSPGLLERLLIGASSVGMWHQKGQKNRYLILKKKVVNLGFSTAADTISYVFLTFFDVWDNDIIPKCQSLFKFAQLHIK